MGEGSVEGREGWHGWQEDGVNESGSFQHLLYMHVSLTTGKIKQQMKHTNMSIRYAKGQSYILIKKENYIHTEEYPRRILLFYFINSNYLNILRLVLSPDFVLHKHHSSLANFNYYNHILRLKYWPIQCGRNNRNRSNMTVT